MSVVAVSDLDQQSAKHFCSLFVSSLILSSFSLPYPPFDLSQLCCKAHSGHMKPQFLEGGGLLTCSYVYILVCALCAGVSTCMCEGSGFSAYVTLCSGGRSPINQQETV